MLVNALRATGGSCSGEPYGPAPEVAMDNALRCAARLHSKDMADNGYFDHISQDGRTPQERASLAGYDGGYPMLENIAAGGTTPQAAVDQWLGSYYHCVNIFNSAVHRIGMGYATGGVYGHYWTQMFGG